ncbi:TetR/AcrR family transcriptional regulator C-terminal domain-containing protein [Cohnella fermenti]|uniref:TetR family transcriptional regulator n=1 Tax=Cohnella fermenti TaxID=2565925 RepID=A0A4V3WFA8_9BACL|nr:TetR/AcrR family transcriptional regulator C-terminal domain-containing protein [Cohnella fermenti]THF79530.1 TetR family transcriptional regulator [Cohnella fermenti]
MSNQTDRRIVKSQNAIKSAFLLMLLEDGFDKITVKSITERADISRKTFYLHYVDKYDLLDSIVNKQLEELGVICEQKKEKGFIEGTVIWFHYFAEHQAFFAALFGSDSTVSFRKQLLQFIMHQLSLKLHRIRPEKDAEVILKFLGMAVLGIVESFVLRQLTAGTEDIARQVGELLEQNIANASVE